MKTSHYIGLLTIPVELGLSVVAYKLLSGDPAVFNCLWGTCLFFKIMTVLGFISLAVLALGLAIGWREYKRLGKQSGFLLCGLSFVLVVLQQLYLTGVIGSALNLFR